MSRASTTREVRYQPSLVDPIRVVKRQSNKECHTFNFLFRLQKLSTMVSEGKGRTYPTK